MEKFDVVVIGSGPGGYVAAIRAAQLGLKTACIEKSSTFGGTCLNVGCIPSKVLLQTSEYYALCSKKISEFGVLADNVRFDFPAMMVKKDEVVKGLVGGVASLLKKNQVTTFKGVASFISPTEISVDGKNISAASFILATGSAPISLPHVPFDEQVILSSTGALELPSPPKKLVVIGGGVIGVEIASIYSRLGSEVTVIEMLDRICPLMDNTVSKTLLQVLKKQGITFHLSSKVTSVKRQGSITAVSFEGGGKEEAINATHVLVAIGRRPFTEGLNLQKAGLETDKRGFLEVNGRFQTKVPHIFAIGDLIDGPMLAHKASIEGVAVVEAIAGLKPTIQYMAIPNIVYTHPEAASVGLTEEEASSFELLIGQSFVRGNPRGRCTGESDGVLKVIGDKKTGRLLGMHIVAPHASELIAEGVAAIQGQFTLERLAHMPHGHPTLTEAILEASLSALGRAIH